MGHSRQRSLWSSSCSPEKSIFIPIVQVGKWVCREVEYLAQGHMPSRFQSQMVLVSEVQVHPTLPPGGKQHLVQRRRTTSSTIMLYKLPRTQETSRTTLPNDTPGEQSEETHPNALALRPCHHGRPSAVSSSPPTSQL